MTDIEFAIYSDGERLGLLTISEGAVVWRHANKKLGKVTDSAGVG